MYVYVYNIVLYSLKKSSEKRNFHEKINNTYLQKKEN